MTDEEKDDRSSLIKNDILDVNHLAYLPNTCPEKIDVSTEGRYKLNYSVNEAFDGTTFRETDTHKNLHLVCKDAGKCITNLPAECDNKDHKRLGISVISGNNDAFCCSRGEKLESFDSLPKVLDMHSNESTKGLEETELTSKKRSGNVKIQKQARLEEENYISALDHSKAFYSAIYIDANLPTSHFGDI